MIKYRILPLLLGLIILIIVCSSISLWMFRTPSNTPCTPIGYPEGTRLKIIPSEIYSFETDTEYANVVDFYRDHLILIPPEKTQYETVKWNEHSIQNNGVLFHCGSKLNKYELELGCIYVHEKDENAVIDILWSYAEGAATPCYILPNIEPEDYLNNP